MTVKEFHEEIRAMIETFNDLHTQDALKIQTLTRERDVALRKADFYMNQLKAKEGVSELWPGDEEILDAEESRGLKLIK